MSSNLPLPSPRVSRPDYPAPSRVRMLFLVVGIMWNVAALAQTIRIGVPAFRPKADMVKQWQPLCAVLKRAIPQYDCVVEAYTYPELDKAVLNKHVDFVLTTPSHFVMLSRRLGVSAPLATLIEEENGIPLSFLSGTIFTRTGRNDIQNLADLNGKTVAAPDAGSFGGYQVQVYVLKRAGLRIHKDVTLKLVGMPHDNAVKAVQDGSADAGFARAGLLEAMAREGKLDLSQFRVLNPQTDPEFPFLHSTRLYPQWPLTALPHMDKSITRRVASALFGLEENTAVTRAMHVRGFTTPSDYTPVEELLRELRLPPFDSVPEFTLHDVWTRYRLEVLTVFVSAVVILLLLTGLLLTNSKLQGKRRKLESEIRLRKGLLDALGEGVYGVNHNGLCMFMNPAAYSMLGFNEAEVIGNDQHALFHHHRADGSAYPEEECPIYCSLLDGKSRSCDEWFWHKDGSGFPVSLTVSPHFVETGHAGAVVVFHDATERRKQEAQIRHSAQHDTLTDLPNRAMLADRLQQALACARRDKQRVALMFVDLDNFKQINDQLGHVVGDWLLKQVAIHMRECVRDSDTVARVGGDEFIVLLRTVDNVDEAVMVAEKIRYALSQPFDLAQQSLNISCSIGIAMYPEHAGDENEMMNYADIAMYQAKQKGRNKVMVFASH